MNYYKHHLGDYAKDTVGLSMLEHGAYRLLLDAYYATENPIYQDEAYAIAKAGTAIERRAVDKVLSRHFQKDGDVFRHKRVQEELGRYQLRASKNRDNGSLGGRPKENPTDNPEETQSVLKPNPEITLAINHKPITKKLPSRMTEAWRLSTEQIEWAVGAKPGWTAEHALKVGDVFRDYWISTGKCKADWDATWRNWVRKEPEKLNAADKFRGVV